MRFGFDKKRHSEYMHLPVDWPRINQFPEYFSVEKNRNYSIAGGSSGDIQIISGKDLQNGYPIKIQKGIGIKLIVAQASDQLSESRN